MRNFVRIGVTALAIVVAPLAASAKWQMDCGAEACELSHTLSNSSGQQIAKMALPRLFKDKAVEQVGFVMLPLGIHIPSSVKVSIDGSKDQIPTTLLDCNVATGCRAAFTVTPKTMKRFKAGRTVAFTVVDGAKLRAVTFNFSLRGFTKAHGKFAQAVAARAEKK